MANESTAYGTMTISATIKEHLEFQTILKHIVRNNYYYGFIPNDDEYDGYLDYINDALKDGPRLNDEIIDIELNAGGTGRWSMESSNENYFEYLANEIKTYEPDEDNTDVPSRGEIVDSFIDIIQSDTFKITVDFYDEESGMGLLYHEVARIYANSEDIDFGTPDFEINRAVAISENIKTEYEIDEDDDYEHNIRNLAEYFDYDDVNALYLDSNRDEYSHDYLDILTELHTIWSDDPLDDTFVDIIVSLQTDYNLQVTKKEVLDLLINNQKYIAEYLTREEDDDSLLIYEPLEMFEYIEVKRFVKILVPLLKD